MRPEPALENRNEGPRHGKATRDPESVQIGRTRDVDHIGGQNRRGGLTSFPLPGERFNGFLSL